MESAQRRGGRRHGMRRAGGASPEATKAPALRTATNGGILRFPQNDSSGGPSAGKPYPRGRPSRAKASISERVPVRLRSGWASASDLAKASSEKSVRMTDMPGDRLGICPTTEDRRPRFGSKLPKQQRGGPGRGATGRRQVAKPFGPPPRPPRRPSSSFAFSVGQT